MSEFARSLAGKQRDRLVGTLLGYLEKEIYPSLTPAKCKEVRERVLAATGVYHDFVLDCLRASTGSGGVTNEEALRLLHAIHSGQASLARALEGHDG